MKEELLALDSVRINFSASGMHLINIVLAFVMFGVALGIDLKVFKNILRSPKSVLVGLLSQLVALPALTFCLTILFNNYISPMVAMGMLLVAACPGGNISNFISQYSKGNTELSISLTAVTSTLSVFITPFNFAFWGNLYVNYNNKAGQALQTLYIDNWQMVETVLILLGIPLFLGILCSRFLPRIAQKLKKPMQKFSILFFIAMVVISFGNNLQIFIRYIPYIFFIVFIHNLVALSSGYGLATLFRLSDPDRRSITIETGIQNSGLGLVLLFNPKIFSPEMAIGGMLLITAWWAIWHIVSGLTIATYWSRKSC